MSNYLSIIKQAIIFFPLIALIINIPFVLIQYHKYGSISFIKVLLTYSFILYLICAYFLVIMPLPTKEAVALLKTPKVQLIPFSFVMDFIKHSSFSITNVSTYFKALTESYFYVPVYNLLLTLPFGMYLRYFFNCDLKKTIIWTFLLSLFFELTQFTGLYFIYSRGYRLFDVDDLILNVLGGIIGYFIIKPLIKILPTGKEIEKNAIIKGKKISGFKRFTSFVFDGFLYLIFSFILYYFFSYNYIFIIMFILYYLIVPFFLKGSTLGEKYLNLQVVSNSNNDNYLIRLLIRKIIFVVIYIVIPYFLSYCIYHFYGLNVNPVLETIIVLLSCLIIFIIYFVSAIKYLFTNEVMLYEKISKTNLISTIK